MRRVQVYRIFYYVMLGMDTLKLHDDLRQAPKDEIDYSLLEFSSLRKSKTLLGGTGIQKEANRTSRKIFIRFFGLDHETTTEQASELTKETDSLKSEFNTVKDEKLPKTQDLEGWIGNL